MELRCTRYAALQHSSTNNTCFFSVLQEKKKKKKAMASPSSFLCWGVVAALQRRSTLWSLLQQAPSSGAYCSAIASSKLRSLLKRRSTLRSCNVAPRCGVAVRLHTAELELLQRCSATPRCAVELHAGCGAVQRNSTKKARAIALLILFFLCCCLWSSFLELTLVIFSLGL